MNPLISVVLTSYNYGHYIQEALESLIQQTYKNFEVIIIDDASTDHSLEVIRPYIKKDPRFSLIVNEKNLGCHASFTKGIQKIQGEFYFGFASDDKILPNFFERCIKAIKANPDIPLFCSRHVCFYSKTLEERVMSPLQLEYQEMKLNRDSLLNQIKVHRFFIPGGTTLVKKECLEKFGYFEEKYGSLGDWFTFHRIAFKYGCYFIPETLTLMRLHEKSLSGSEKIEKKWIAWANVIKELSKPKNKFYKEAFVRSHIFNTLGFHFFEFILKRPRYWLFFKLYVYKHFYKRWKKHKKAQVQTHLKT